MKPQILNVQQYRCENLQYNVLQISFTTFLSFSRFGEHLKKNMYVLAVLVVINFLLITNQVRFSKSQRIPVRNLGAPKYEHSTAVIY